MHYNINMIISDIHFAVYNNRNNKITQAAAVSTKDYKISNITQVLCKNAQQNHAK